LILPIALLITEYIKNKKLNNSILRKVIPLVSIVLIIYLNPLKILLNIGIWKTQTVELIDKNSEKHKVEFQMKDIGALGYAKRNAEVYYLTGFFYIVLNEKYHDRKSNGTDWKKVGEEINEIGLK
jgi:hypothetical protein